MHVQVYWRHQHVLSGYDHLYSRKDRRSSEHETCAEWHSKVLDVIGDMICHTFPDIWHWWRLMTNYSSFCGNVSEMFTSLFYLESSKGDLCWKTCEVTLHLMAKFDLNFTLGFKNIYFRNPWKSQHGVRCVADVSKLPFFTFRPCCSWKGDFLPVKREWNVEINDTRILARHIPVTPVMQ